MIVKGRILQFETETKLTEKDVTEDNGIGVLMSYK